MLCRQQRRVAKCSPESIKKGGSEKLRTLESPRSIESRSSEIQPKNWLVFAGGLLIAGVASVAGGAERPPARLGTFYQERAQEILHLAREGEIQLLAGLRTDRDRERFFREFWAARGEGTAQRMRANRRDAQRLALRAQGQSDVVLLAGKPTSINRFEACQSVVRRIEVWEYDAFRVDRQRRLSAQESTSAEAKQSIFLVFVQRTNLDPRSFELWDRDAESDRLVFGDGRGVAPADLVKEAVTLGCVNPQSAAELRRGLEKSLTFGGLVDALGWPQPNDWWQGPGALSAPLQESVAQVALDPSGKFFRQVLVTGTLTVPTAALNTLDGNELYDRVEILGDVYQGDRLIDPFRIVHHLAGAAPPDEIALDFYRRLLPGQYAIKLRVENAAGKTLLQSTETLMVPKLEQRAEQPAGRRRDINQLTRADVVFLTTSPSVEIIPPETFPVAGPVTVEAVARGGRVAAVEFVPEGGARRVDQAPPFLADVVMEQSRVLLTANAVDAAGLTLATDVVTLRRDAVPFRVWFDPAAENADEHVVRVQVPEQEVLASLICFQNGTEVKRFEGSRLNADARILCPKQPPRADMARLRFDRVAARLVSGEEVEDVLILSQLPEELDVRLVELFVSVLDQQGRPVTDLDAAQFSVLEDGESQPIERVNAVERLPLSISVMMDTSSSMGRRVRLAVQSTQAFFQDLMRDGDVASLFAFQHDLLPLVDFTGERRELEYAAQGLRGSGGTRLYDGLIYNLHSFAGLPARRAMVVLSDGADTESDATAAEALAAAQRSGVLVFPVALGRVGETTEGELRTLARETGGAFFAVDGVGGLDGVYRQIVKILRSQYQVLYRPIQERAGRGYQQVEIKLGVAGLSVRNVRGYYR